MSEFDVSWFAIRTPLLPVDEFLNWTSAATPAADVATPDASDTRRRELRAYLDTMLERPEVRDALLLASQDLVDGLAEWRHSPQSRKGQRAEQALVRYFTRMCTRPTPFGLFSGWSIGQVGPTTALRLQGRESYRRHIQIDSSYVLALAERLAESPEAAGAAHFHPNETICERPDEVRYAVAPRGGGAVQFRSVARTAAVQHCLGAARHGATIEELVATLCRAMPEVSSTDAAAFVDALIRADLLHSDFIPALTGPEPFASLVSSCQEFIGQSSVSKALVEVSGILADADGRSPGDGERYKRIVATLPEARAAKRVDRTLRANLIKPAAQVTLGPEPLAEIHSALRLLERIGISNIPHEESLARFRKEFHERYESRPVRLTDVFDDDNGLDWGKNDERGFSPVLDGLVFEGSPAPPALRYPPGVERLRAKLAAATKGEVREVVIQPEDLDPASEPWIQFADSFQVSAILDSASEEACRNGQFRVILQGVSGPPAVRVFGRCCHSDADLRARVTETLRTEEQLRPEAVFAEIAYAPPGSTRNVVVRPNLREYEIPFLGRSGVASDKQILVTDLWVAVSGERITLFSRRLRREVVPSLTSAHNYNAPGQPRLYRFLCAIARARLPAHPFWEAHEERHAYMPRVVFGRVVLSPARWQIGASDLAAILAAEDAAQFGAVQDLRARMRWPRYVGLVDFENELIVDLDNPLSTAAVVPLLKRLTTPALFVEWLPEPGSHCARGPEGSFTHEIILPVTRTHRQDEHQFDVRAAEASLAVSPSCRTFSPGSAWSYVKLYAGQLALDRILREIVRPLVAGWTSMGVADRWFFIRYSDPEPHIRLRVRTDGGGGLGRIVDDVNETLASSGGGELVRRVQYDSYEREVERYGGIEAMELSESIFQADSACALDLMATTGGRDVRQRWTLALQGGDRLLDDLGLTAAEKLALVKGHRDGLWRPLTGKPALRRGLAARYRSERATLEALLGASGGDPEVGAALARRSEELRPLGARLAELEQSQRLSATRLAICNSYLHMHLNRMLAVDSAAQELVIADFLHQLYTSRSAKGRARH